MNTEKFISGTTQTIVYSLHFLLFIGFIGFSVKKFLEDKKRIYLAQKRREARKSSEKKF